ncbi:hypothetical protein COLO4_32781 [Corchorus olitorius]|uniref:Uncharacterized protein n=1 Tax=Corchorus olitorius TaxID=93759 RepID=A0A1R3GYB6_9ROSI|nr:hypothetical protein COLO4_32781 [Corchorus olitorius]
MNGEKGEFKARSSQDYSAIGLKDWRGNGEDERVNGWVLERKDLWVVVRPDLVIDGEGRGAAFGARGWFEEEVKKKKGLLIWELRVSGSGGLMFFWCSVTRGRGHRGDGSCFERIFGLATVNLRWRRSCSAAKACEREREESSF